MNVPLNLLQNLLLFLTQVKPVHQTEYISSPNHRYRLLVKLTYYSSSFLSSEVNIFIIYKSISFILQK